VIAAILRARVRRAIAGFILWVAKTSLALNSGKLVAVVKQAAGDRSSVRLAERLTLTLSPHAFFADHRYLMGGRLSHKLCKILVTYSKYYA